MRSLWSIGLLCLVASTLTAQQPAKWEYGRLVAISGHTVSWAAGDSSVRIEIPTSQFLAQAGPDSVTRSPAPMMDILNRLGAQGWEMIAATDNTYFFKRRKP